MALEKASLPINFAQGLDLKTDPFQVNPGKMLALQNSVFNKGGLLTKRSGYRYLSPLPTNEFKYLTTYNEGLTAISDRLDAYSQGTNTWVDKGGFIPLSLSVVPAVRAATNQVQADSATAANGLVCTAYTDLNGSVSTYKYVVMDGVTGQNIIPPTTIVPVGGSIVGSPRVFLLGPNFIIAYSSNITGTNHLEYIAVSVNNPTSVVPATNITSQYTPNSRVAWDGVVANNNLYLAWNGSDGGGAIRMTYIDSTLTQHTTVVFAGRVATIMSVTADTSSATAVIWASFYNSGTSTGYSLAVNQQLNTVLAPTQTIAAETVLNITSVATAGVATIFYEVSDTYDYDTAISTNFVKRRTITQAGVLGTAATVDRGIGLASKGFYVNEVAYFLAAYNSAYQPTYFLLDSTGKVAAKLAYSNGGGYLALGLPAVTVRSSSASVAYLFRDLIQAVNKTQGVANTAGIYSQTGVNVATFNLSPSVLSTAEIGSDLHLGGGFLWMYDGVAPVEQGFHLWPDYVEATSSLIGGNIAAEECFYYAVYEWTDARGNIFRSAPSIPADVTVVANAFATHAFNDTNVNVGADTITITAHGWTTGMSFTLTTAGTLAAPLTVGPTYYIIVVDANTVKVASSYANAIALTAINLTTTGSGLSTIEPTEDQGSNTVYVPTLRLTYKTATPIKIVLYRGSVGQATAYQVTSITSPVLNDTAVDYITFIDTLSDAQILGNSIIYTTGGIIENIAPPATDIMALYKSRLLLVDSEDRNLLWFSKQVIQGVPVETSDLFTVYVAPTTAAQGNTGPITALSAMDDKLIVFKQNAIYYLTGNGPDNTGINNDLSEPVFITATVGCVNQASIVFVPQGLMFQSDKGIWLLSRDLSTSYIGAAVENYNDSTVLSAVNVPGTNQVRLTLSSGITLMYDYFYGQWGTFVNVPAVTSTIYQGLHCFIDSYGRVFQESPGVYLDGTKPVLLSFTTSWLNLAGLQGYERAYFFYLLGVYITPHKLQIQIAYDYNSSPTQTSIITPDNYTPNWGGEQLWGSGGNWGGNGNVEQHRVFLQQQKCEAFQITLTEIYDPSLGVPAGAGFTLSGVNCVVGLKSQYPRLKASKSVG